jgi:hypothetical protein
MITLIIGVAVGLLVSRTSMATTVYTAASDRMSFLPKP